MTILSPSANQFIVNTNYFSAFQSYSTLIAVRKNKQLYVSDSWDYSRTTLKYFKQFAYLESMSKSDIQKLIKDGSIILLNDIDLHNLCACTSL